MKIVKVTWTKNDVIVTYQDGSIFVVPEKLTADVQGMGLADLQYEKATTDSTSLEDTRDEKKTSTGRSADTESSEAGEIITQ